MITALEDHFAQSANTDLMGHLLSLCTHLQVADQEPCQLKVVLEDHFAGLLKGNVVLPERVKVMFVLASLNDHYCPITDT